MARKKYSRIVIRLAVVWGARLGRCIITNEQADQATQAMLRGSFAPSAKGVILSRGFMHSLADKSVWNEKWKAKGKMVGATGGRRLMTHKAEAPPTNKRSNTVILLGESRLAHDQISTEIRVVEG